MADAPAPGASDGGPVKLTAADSDEALIARFVGGQSECFEQLVGRYSRPLFRFLARFVGSAAAAEDLLQETFLQVFTSAESFQEGRRFKPWLFTIAANKARDHLRSRRRRGELALDATVGGDEESASFADLLANDLQVPEDQAGRRELQENVAAVIDRLPDHFREVLVLGYYERMPYKQIAEILDVPLGTVKSRLHAAVGQFARAWRKASASPDDLQA